MRRALYLLMVLSLSYTTVKAQQPKIEKSEVFDEPGEGWNKVLQMKNGSTFFFHYSSKKGIDVTVFDKNRKITATPTIKGKKWSAKKVKKTAFAGLYEINGEPVLFLTQNKHNEPTLFRMRINPLNGQVKKEDMLGSVSQMHIFSFMGMGANSQMGAPALSAIYVEKDPVSDCYAVIYFNGTAHDKDDRIRVVHYDGTDKVVNDAYFDSPDPDFKFLNFIGAVVDGNKRVYISTYGAESRKGKEGHVFISRLNSVDSVFYTKPLDFTEDFRYTTSLMSYDHNNNTIQLLTTSQQSHSGGLFSNSSLTHFAVFMSYLDPENLTLKSVKTLSGEKMAEYANRTMGKDVGYKGLPQQMVINKDNTTTILTEEMKQVTTTYTSGHSTYTTYNTYLGGIGVSELTENGVENKGYVIMKNQDAKGILNAMYVTGRTNGVWSPYYSKNNENMYLSFNYINTDKNRYILFNDNGKNFERDESETKRKMVTKVSKLNTICYSLNADGTVNKFYLFGDPESKKLSNSCYIDAADFQPSTNTYATIMIERDGRDRGAKLAWITFP